MKIEAGTLLEIDLNIKISVSKNINYDEKDLKEKIENLVRNYILLKEKDNIEI